MADLGLFAKTLVVSAVVAGLALLLAAHVAPGNYHRRISAGWILGLGAGIYAGCGVLGEWPRWPAPEDRDRFLVILLPLTLAIELAAAWLESRLATNLLRLCLAGAAAPILLHNSVYLAEHSGPNSAEWTTAQAAAILFALAAFLSAVWGLLTLMPVSSSRRTSSAALAMLLPACGLTVMLSGYYRGGLLGLSLAGAMAGATLASCVLPPAHARPYLGIGLMGAFSVLLIGRFYGALPTSTAIGLLLTPLLLWITEAPGIRTLGPRARAAAQLLLVAAPLVLIVVDARMKFNAAFSASPRPVESSR